MLPEYLSEREDIALGGSWKLAKLSRLKKPTLGSMLNLSLKVCFQDNFRSRARSQLKLTWLRGAAAMGCATPPRACSWLNVIMPFFDEHLAGRRGLSSNFTVVVADHLVDVGGVYAAVEFAKVGPGHRVLTRSITGEVGAEDLTISQA